MKSSGRAVAAGPIRSFEEQDFSPAKQQAPAVLYEIINSYEKQLARFRGSLQLINEKINILEDSLGLSELTDEYIDSNSAALDKESQVKKSPNITSILHELNEYNSWLEETNIRLSKLV